MCSYNKAYAYSCMVVPLNPQLEMISGHIFEGKVLKTDVKKSLNPFRTPREKAQFVEFKVQKIWNGNFDYLMDEDGVIEVLEPLQGGGGCRHIHAATGDVRLLVSASHHATHPLHLDKSHVRR